MPNMKFKYLTDSVLHALHHTKSILIPSKIPSKRQVYVTPRFPRRHNESKKVLRFHQNLCLYKSTILRHTVKLGIKELLNNEQTWLKDLSTDYQPCYTINPPLNKELLPIYEMPKLGINEHEIAIISRKGDFRNLLDSFWDFALKSAHKICNS